ncbi:4940_t:CDS:1, partial [Scutellospora calospora]
EIVVINEIEKMLDKRIEEVEEYHLKSPQLGPTSPIYIPASPT